MCIADIHMNHNKTTADKSKSGPHWYKVYIRNVCILYTCVADLIFHSMVSTIYMITYWIAILVNYFDAFVNSHCNDVMISDGVSNHRHLDCLLNRLFRRRLEEASKIRVTGLCEGNPRATGGFPSQIASNTENVSIWWCLHEYILLCTASRSGGD